MADRRRIVRVVGVFALMLGVAFAVHWPAAKYPYVQEDWEVFGAFSGEPAGRAIGQAFAAVRQIHYRPLVSAYHIVMHRLFGLDGLPSHLLVIVFLAASAAALAALVRELTGEARLALLAGAAHAAANVIHVDALMIQTCGIENQVGATCFFLGTLAFLRRRGIASALLYAAGILVKETVVILPGFLLLCATVMTGGEERLRARLRGALLRLLPHALVIVPYLAIKSRGLSPFRLPANAAYHMSLFGPHLWGNLATYVRWTLEVLVPGASPIAAALVALAVGGLALFTLRPLDGERRRRLARWGLFFGAWYLYALGPMLILPNHVFRYYLVFALPAALVVWWAAIRQLLGKLLGARGDVAAAVLALALVGQAGWSFHRRELAGTDLDGSNATLERAGTVARVWPFLRDLRPPRGSTLLFDGLEVWSFGKEAGPRLWCDDPTLEVYDARDLRWPAGEAPAIVNAARHQGELYSGAHNRHVLDPEKTFVIHAIEDRLTVEPLKARGPTRD